MKNKIFLERILRSSLLLTNVVFLVYWCILAYYSQLHYDDLHFLWRMREMSVFDFVKYFYLTRSGRFVVYGIDAVVSIIIDAIGFHQICSLVYYFVGIGICWLAVKNLKLQVSSLGVLLGVCFVYNLYVLTNIDFPVFYWPCAMMYYLSMPCAMLLIKYLNLEHLKWSQWIVFIVIVVFLGGSYETYVPIVLLFMLVNGLYFWRSKDWNVRATWSMPQVRRIVYTAVALLLLLSVVVVAPGNFNRLNQGMGIAGEGFMHPQGVVGWSKAMIEAVGMFSYFMTFYIPYYISVMFMGVYVGGKLTCRLPAKKSVLILGIVLAFLVYLIVLALPNVYLYNGFGIQRSYTPAVLTLLLVFSAIGCVIGVGNDNSVSGWCATIMVLILMTIMSVNIAEDTPIARCYGEAVNERFEYLINMQEVGTRETVIVEPLPVPYTEDVKHFVLSRMGKESPKSVLYYISDADTVPNEYESHLRKVLRLDYDFVISNETTQ